MKGKGRTSTASSHAKASTAAPQDGPSRPRKGRHSAQASVHAVRAFHCCIVLDTDLHCFGIRCPRRCSKASRQIRRQHSTPSMSTWSRHRYPPLRTRCTTGTWFSRCRRTQTRRTAPSPTWHWTFCPLLVRHAHHSSFKLVLTLYTLAASTDVERAFSRGHLTVSQLRHSLGEDSVRAGTVVGSWARIPDLLDEDHLASFLKPPTPRPVKKAAVAPSRTATSTTSNSQGGPLNAIVLDSD